MATVYIKQKRARPFFFRHPWVFSGAVSRIDGQPADGDAVDVADASGKFIGRGFINTGSQIVVRLMTWDADEQIDRALFGRRFAAARSLREDVLGLTNPDDACRLVFGESDGLPGLIVDRYAGRLVVQIGSLGMHRVREMLFDVLDETFSPSSIYLRSPSGVSDLEGLGIADGTVRGEEPPDDIRVNVDGLLFGVNVMRGQKTGLYLDQRENRGIVARLAAGRRVFDGFSYTGGFAIAAAKGGAADVTAADTSARAIEAAMANAELNGVEGARFITGDAVDTLRTLRKEGERFGLVILDPPKFARSRGHVRRAIGKYRDVNAAGIASLERDGLLVSFSCSQHVDATLFESIINEAAVSAGRSAQIIRRLVQPGDHPVAASCPETRYLKGVVCRCR